jgi:o-succinylbenzoate synthase
MLITKIEIYKSPIKLKEPFVISLGMLAYAENAIVRIRTKEGITGIGECSPFKTINGESMDTCFIVGQYLAKGLLGMDPLDIEVCSTVMDKIIYGNCSIKSAFDMALYDIASQHTNLPLFRFLNGNDQKQLITDYTVSIGDPDQMAIDALKIKENGFRLIKVKLGETKEKDFERIRKIREAIGYDIPLRIDANQGWDTAEAIQLMQALEPFQIQYCEEPIPRWNFMELSKIRKQSPIPIMADESCCDHHDLKRLIDLGSCDLINIKLGKSSGIFNALKMIQLAENAGINIQIGGFLESRLGFTAAAHLALTSDRIIYFDFDTPLMFTEDPVEGGITYQGNGIIDIPETPGLGATIEEHYLRRQETIVVE